MTKRGPTKPAKRKRANKRERKETVADRIRAGRRASVQVSNRYLFK